MVAFQKLNFFTKRKIVSVIFLFVLIFQSCETKKSDNSATLAAIAIALRNRTTATSTSSTSTYRLPRLQLPPP